MTAKAFVPTVFPFTMFSLAVWGQKSPFHCVKDANGEPVMRKGDAWCLPNNYTKERPDFMGEIQ